MQLIQWDGGLVDKMAHFGCVEIWVDRVETVMRPCAKVLDVMNKKQDKDPKYHLFGHNRAMKDLN